MSQATALTTAKRTLIRQTIRSMPTSRLVLMLANADVTSTFLRDHVVSQHRQDLQWAVQSLSDELDARVPAPSVPTRASTQPTTSVPVVDTEEARPVGMMPTIVPASATVAAVTASGSKSSEDAALVGG